MESKLGYFITNSIYNESIYTSFVYVILCSSFVWIFYSVRLWWNELYSCFWSFLQCILKCKFWLYAITMNLMLEWMVVLGLLRLKTKIVNIWMWNENLLLVWNIVQEFKFHFYHLVTILWGIFFLFFLLVMGRFSTNFVVYCRWECSNE